MIQRDPELIIVRLLTENWPTDLDVDADRISDGWWDESDDGHQVTVTHFSSNVEGETGYTGIGPTGGLKARWDGSVTVDVWIAYNDSFASMGEAKDLRWSAQQYVRDIIADHAGGTVYEGEVELTRLGVVDIERNREDGKPPVFRSRIRVSYGYGQG